MRFLPHDPDSTCADGRRHGSMPELWTDGHFPHACAGRGPDAPVVSSAHGHSGSGPGACAGLVSCTSVSHDGRNAGHEHARFQSQHRTATEACPRPAAPQRWAQYSCKPATVGFDSGIPCCPALDGFSRCSCWSLGSWAAQSVTLHSRCAATAKHGPHGRRRWDARNARHAVWRVTPRQRCVPCTFLPGHTASPGHGRSLSQPGRCSRA